MSKIPFFETMSDLCGRVGSHLPFLKPKLTEAEVEEFSIEFFQAAIENDVAYMKKLRKKGADINFKTCVIFGESEAHIRPPTWNEKCEKSTALMAALHAGSYDAALYLIQQKADATCSHSHSDWETALNALDHLVTADRPTKDPNESRGFHVPKAKNRAKDYLDLFSPEQRVTLFKAMIENTSNPLDLLSENTMKNVITWGRAELIPDLVGIGIKITNRHFVEAAHPLHNPHMAIPMLEAFLPHVKNVNVTAYETGMNAGHEAAAAYDLPTFMWLEKRDLKKEAFAGAVNVPTYAHNLVRDGIHPPAMETRLAFANHLKEKGYPLDIPNATRYGQNTPTDLAFQEGSFELGLFYLKAGTAPKPKQLAYAISCLHHNGTTAKDLLKLFDDLEAEGFLSQQAMQAGFDAATTCSRLNAHCAKKYQPIIDSLLKHGLKLNEKDAAVAHELLENYVPEQATGRTQSPPLSECKRN